MEVSVETFTALTHSVGIFSAFVALLLAAFKPLLNDPAPHTKPYAFEKN